MGFVNLTIRIYWKDVLPWPWNSEELIPQTNRKNVHITYSWSVLCPPSEVVMQFINKVWESVWEKTECSWTMVLESGVKQRVGWIKKRTGRSYCDFLMFVHQRTREDSGHQCGKRVLQGFINQWGGHAPMTTLIYLWRVRLVWPRTLDFHSKDQGFESPTRYQVLIKKISFNNGRY